MDETIKVTCAIIEDNERVMAARRGENMSMALKWEFPGGKVEEGESYEACIKRELEEEMDIHISITDSLPCHIHRYEHKTIELIPFVCKIEGGELKLKEHKEMLWIKVEDFLKMDWAEADIAICIEYTNYLKNRYKK